MLDKSVISEKIILKTDMLAEELTGSIIGILRITDTNF